MVDVKRAEHKDSLTKLSHVITAVKNAHHLLQHAASLSISLDPSKSVGMESSKKLTYVVDNFLNYHDMMDDMKSFQQYLLKLIEIGVQNRYRRYRDGIYEEVYTKEGFRTNFWRRVDDIKEFVNKCSSRDHMDMWLFATEGRNKAAAVDALTNM